MVATDIMIFTKEFVSHCIWGVRYRSTHERFKYKTQNCTINASISQSIFRCGCYCYILKARNSCVKAFVSVCPSVHKSQAFETGPIDSHNICWTYIFNVPLFCVPILYWKFKAKVRGETLEYCDGNFLFPEIVSLDLPFTSSFIMLNKVRWSA